MNIPDSIIENILYTMEQAITDKTTVYLKKIYATLNSLYREGSVVIPAIDKIISKDELANLKVLSRHPVTGLKRTIPGIRRLQKLFPSITLQKTYEALEYIDNYL